jgi:hypothetical protein
MKSWKKNISRCLKLFSVEVDKEKFKVLDESFVEFFRNDYIIARIKTRFAFCMPRNEI